MEAAPLPSRANSASINTSGAFDETCIAWNYVPSEKCESIADHVFNATQNDLVEGIQHQLVGTWGVTMEDKFALSRFSEWNYGKSTYTQKKFKRQQTEAIVNTLFDAPTATPWDNVTLLTSSEANALAFITGVFANNRVNVALTNSNMNQVQFTTLILRCTTTARIMSSSC